ncbi:MAG: tetratricopeptide repeat protein [Cyclobacteriaceae bacterium]
MKVILLLASLILSLQANAQSDLQIPKDSALSLSREQPKFAITYFESFANTFSTNLEGNFLYGLAEIHYAAGSPMDSVDKYFLLSYEKHKELRQDSLAFEALLQNGISHRRAGLYNKARTYYEDAVNFAKEIDNPLLEAEGTNALGVALYYRGESVEALKCYLKAMKVYENLDLPSKLAKSYNNIGIIYKVFNNYDLAIEYYEKSLQIRIANNLRNQNAPYFNLNELHHFIGDHEKAITYSKNALRKAIDAKNEDWEIDVTRSLVKDYQYLLDFDSMKINIDKFNKMIAGQKYMEVIGLKMLANYYLQIEKPYKTLSALDSAYQTFVDEDDLNNIEWSHIYYGDAYQQLKKHQKAIRNYEKALSLAKGENFNPMIRLALERLHIAHEKAGDFKTAYHSLNALRLAQDSTYNESKASIAGGMEARMDLLEEENRNILLEKDAEVQSITIQNQRTTIGLISIIFIGTFVIGFLTYRQQKIKKKLAESELRVTEENQKRMKVELDHKNGEIVNLAMQITSKNEWFEEVKKNLEHLKRSNPQAKEYKDTKDILTLNESITKDRNEFEAHIQQVCEGFFSNLSHLYPDISMSDKRLAALLRLELSSKDISTVLNISPKSVDMSRYRLRKKMGLDSKSNLVEVLQSI